MPGAIVGVRRTGRATDGVSQWIDAGWGERQLVGRHQETAAQHRHHKRINSVCRAAGPRASGRRAAMCSGALARAAFPCFAPFAQDGLSKAGRC